MANSAFKIEKVETIIPIAKGGTGSTSLSDKGVLVGAGVGSITTVAPGVSGNYLVSNGTDWTSGTASGIGGGTVSYSKLAPDLISIQTISASNVDWSTGAIFTKTLSSNTTLTFSNTQLDKIISLEISGNYTLSLPSSVSILGGTYIGNVINYITLHCTNTNPQEIWATISQNLPVYYYGYFIGGTTGTVVSTADRIIFSSGITSVNTVSNLSQSRSGLAGISDGFSNGYLAGGMIASTAKVATTDRIVFSTGITSVNTVSNLSQLKYSLAGISDGSSYGYFSGGFTDSVIATTDRIVFSSGVTSVNTVSNLSQARSGLTGISYGSSYGYLAGGTIGSVVSTTDRIVFSSGVTSVNTVSNLSQARYILAGISDGSSYGYFSGGNTGVAVATTDRIVFSTGITSANTVSNLSQARGGLSGVSDGSSYGYLAGGNVSGSYLALSERLIFSTGVSSSNAASNLSQARMELAGLSDFAV